MRVVTWHITGEISIHQYKGKAPRDLPSGRMSCIFGSRYDDVELDTIPEHLIINKKAYYRVGHMFGSYHYPDISFLRQRDHIPTRHISDMGSCMDSSIDIDIWRGVESNDVPYLGTYITHLETGGDHIIACRFNNGEPMKCIIPSPRPDEGNIISVVFSQREVLKILLLYETGLVYKISNNTQNFNLSNVLKEGSSHPFEIYHKGKVTGLGMIGDHMFVREEGKDIIVKRMKLLSLSSMIPVVSRISVKSAR